MSQNIAAVGGATGTTISLVSATIQTDPVYQTISLIVTLLGLLITLVTTVIIPIVKWYKKAKEDGKVDSSELDELSDTLNSGKESLKNKPHKEDRD